MLYLEGLGFLETIISGSCICLWARVDMSCSGKLTGIENLKFTLVLTLKIAALLYSQESK